jgi:cysteinyl-tRNA synthetase
MNQALYLYNTLTDKKELFSPLDSDCITMYVCGPTVYDRAHLGNARSVVVYDVLYRILRKIFTSVKYLRNITDIDDKIIKSALEEKVNTKEISERYTKFFQQDMEYLNCLDPTMQPKATEYIPQMIELIEKLISEKKAYIKNGSVYFDVSEFSEYGKLSKRKIGEQISGIRIQKNEEKESNEDFALWKVDKTDTDAIFESPWGLGRPGWHIECSAMTCANFGYNFDIHGGGGDLKFPHHENEIAQVCAAHPEAHYANYWVHNGFLMVNGEKMSKSLGNFISIGDLIGKKINGNVIRYALLSADYGQALDWNDNLIEQSRSNLNKIIKLYRDFNLYDKEDTIVNDDLHEEFWLCLLNDMNTSSALMSLQTLANKLCKIDNIEDKKRLFIQLKNSFKFLGFDIKSLMKKKIVDDARVNELIEMRKKAKIGRNFQEADRLRDEITKLGVILSDKKDGSVEWESEDDF